MRQTYWKFFIAHILTGLAFTLLLSLGVTYLLATGNPLLLLMAVVLAAIDYVASRRIVRSLTEDEQEDDEDTFYGRLEPAEEESPTVEPHHVLAISVTGFGLGMLFYLVSVLTVF